jgi:uncharacterized phage protein (TIGR01671 family)
MREIKFRIWNGEKMFYPHQEFGLELLFNKTWGWTLWDTSKPIHECLATSDDGRSKLMEYTGLKDCNEKEIYEGDIIRDNDGFLWVVYFEDGMYCAKGGEYETVEYLIEFCPEWCEVIGNIYEHPHLLEVED